MIVIELTWRRYSGGTEEYRTIGIRALRQQPATPWSTGRRSTPTAWHSKGKAQFAYQPGEAKPATNTPGGRPNPFSAPSGSLLAIAQILDSQD
jgi:hypothetical protein